MLHLVIKNWFKQTQCLIYSTKIDSVMLYYLTIEKGDTMYYLIYCVILGYFCSLKNGLTRHTVIGISWRLIQFCCNILPLKKQTFCVSYFTVVNFVIQEWMKQTHSVRYSTKIESVIFHYLTSEKEDTAC